MPGIQYAPLPILADVDVDVDVCAASAVAAGLACNCCPEFLAKTKRNCSVFGISQVRRITGNQGSQSVR